MLSRSSAGPGAGSSSLFLRVGSKIVRLEVVREGPAPMELREYRGRFDITSGENVLARGVVPMSGGLHAPGQAFINIHDSCRYRCAFCTIGRGPRGPSPERWEAVIKDALRARRVRSVALTTGIPSTPSKACRDMARMVRSIRAAFPRVPIGVEPYTVNEADLEEVRLAGADELKLNIQCATDEIFEKVCPGLDRKGIWRNLSAGVRLFGRGKVCSNLIIGLGETDRDVLSVVEKLAGMGVAANLRSLKTGPLNDSALEEALGRRPTKLAAARLVRLASAQKGIFEKHRLHPSVFRTMCHRCTACDMEPFVDL
jgi:biotin synthase-related radical SAM superfamily protein